MSTDPDEVRPESTDKEQTSEQETEQQTEPELPNEVSKSDGLSLVGSPVDSTEMNGNMSSQAPSPSNVKDTAIFEAEVASLTQVIQTSSNKVCRTAVRQNWRKCLVGGKGDNAKEARSDESFNVRAILKYGDEYVLKRVMDEYGDRLLAKASDDVLRRLMESHGERLLKMASPEMLDRAMEMRLPQVESKKLVKMLSAADRLGYEESDIVDEHDEKVGVMPAERASHNDSSSDPMDIDPPTWAPDTDSMAHLPNPVQQNLGRTPLPVPMLQTTVNPAGSAQIVLASRSKEPNHVPGSKHVCSDCGGSFTQSAGLRYHTANKVCQKGAKTVMGLEPRYQCEFCRKPFTNSKGLQYHNEHSVCRTLEIAKGNPPNGQPPPTYAAPQMPGARSLQPFHQNTPPSPNSQPPYTNPQNAPTAQHLAPQPPPRQPLPSLPSKQTLPPPAYYGPPPNPSHYPVASQRYGAPVNGPFPPPNQVPPHVQQSQYMPITDPNPSVNAPAQHYPDFRVTTGNPATKSQTPARQVPLAHLIPSSSPQLDPQSFAEMTSKLNKEQERYEKKMSEIPENLTAIDRDEEIQKIKRGHATRKSMIRKAYGIQVRRSKLRPANAVTTPEGSLDMAAITAAAGSPASTPGSGFAPINRLDAFRAQPLATPTAAPGRHQLPSAPQGRPGPPLEGSDPKRRRYDDSSDSSVQYVGERTPSSGPPSNERARHPLPLEISVDPVVSARIRDITERNKFNDSSAEGSRPTSAGSASTTSDQSEEVVRPKIPTGTSQRIWEERQPKPVSDSRSKSPDVQDRSSSVSREIEVPPVVQVVEPKKVTTISDDSDSGASEEDIPARRPLPFVSHSRSASESAGLASTAPTTRSRALSRSMASPVSMKSARATATA